MALLCLPACLELNPDFGEGDGTETGAPGVTSNAQSSSGPTSETSAGQSSSGTAACLADSFEPNDEYGQATDVISLDFSLSATLDSASELDWYKGFAGPDGVVELFARVTPSTLRSCIYIGCNSTPDLPTIDKCTGVLDTAPNGEPGCCGPGVVSIEYTCAEGFDVIFHARVDNPASEECTPYDAEFGTL